ncbi:hypothetical protein ACNR9Q_02980 [Maribacter sp. X9]
MIRKGTEVKWPWGTWIVKGTIEATYNVKITKTIKVIKVHSQWQERK